MCIYRSRRLIHCVEVSFLHIYSIRCRIEYRIRFAHISLYLRIGYTTRQKYTNPYLILFCEIVCIYAVKFNWLLNGFRKCEYQFELAAPRSDRYNYLFKYYCFGRLGLDYRILLHSKFQGRTNRLNKLCELLQ